MPYKETELKSLKEKLETRKTAINTLKEKLDDSDEAANIFSLRRNAVESLDKLLKLIGKMQKNISDPISYEEKATLNRLFDQAGSLIIFIEQIDTTINNNQATNTKFIEISKHSFFFGQRAKAVNAIDQILAQLTSYNRTRSKNDVKGQRVEDTIQVLNTLRTQILDYDDPSTAHTLIKNLGNTISSYQSNILSPTLQDDAKGTSLLSTFHQANRAFDIETAQASKMLGVGIENITPEIQKALQLILQLRLLFSEFKLKFGQENSSNFMASFFPSQSSQVGLMKNSIQKLNEIEHNLLTGEQTQLNENDIQLIKQYAAQAGSNELAEAVQKNVSLYNSGLPKIDEDKIKAELEKQFPNDLSKVETYLQYIRDLRAVESGKIHRVKSGLTHTIVKVKGEYFLFLKKLGAGYCGSAKLAINLATGEKMVVKVTKPFVEIWGEKVNAIAANEKRILTKLELAPKEWSREINFESFNATSLLNPANFSRALSNQRKTYMTQPLAMGIPGERVVDLPLSIEKADQFIFSVLKAMQMLHKKNVFHGDIKLENIIYDSDTGNSTFIDFGLSQLVDTEGNVADNQLWIAGKQIVGVTHMQCPDWQRAQTCGLDTDIYALGLMLKDFLDKVKLEGSTEDIAAFKENIMKRIITPMLETERKARPTIDTLVNEMAPKPSTTKSSDNA